MSDILDLPEKVDYLVDYKNDEMQFVEDIYKVFQNDFIFTSPRCNGKLVTVSLKKMDGDDKLAIFWHLISRDTADKSRRELNIFRAERLPWIKPLIEFVPSPPIKYWRYLEGGGVVRHYIWAEIREFVIILQELKMSLRLVTAFRVDENWKEKDLLKKFANRIR
jgi:hypothetical protein